MVTGIRHWSTPDYTRVAIDVDREVKYEAGRVSNPDRIFFDLPDTKLASVLVGKSFDVQDGFLKKIRVAQYQPGYTRVVLEVADVSDYSAFLLPNPYRLIIDIHGRQSQTQVARAQPPVAADEDDSDHRCRRKEALANGSFERDAGQRSVQRQWLEEKTASAASKTGDNGDGMPRPVLQLTGAHRPLASQRPNTPRRKVIVDENDDVATAHGSRRRLENERSLAANQAARRAPPRLPSVTTPDDSLLSSARATPRIRS